MWKGISFFLHHGDQIIDRCKGLMTGRLARCIICLSVLTVIDMQSLEDNALCLQDMLDQCQCSCTRSDTCSVHAHIDVCIDIDLLVLGMKDRSDRCRSKGMIGDTRETSGGILGYQFQQPLNLGPYGLMGQQYIRCPLQCQQFSFGNGSTLEFCDAGIQHHANAFGSLVCFDMGTKPCHIAGHANHFCDVAADNARIHQEGR